MIGNEKSSKHGKIERGRDDWWEECLGPYSKNTTHFAACHSHERNIDSSRSHTYLDNFLEVAGFLDFVLAPHVFGP